MPARTRIPSWMIPAAIVLLPLLVLAALLAGGRLAPLIAPFAYSVF